MDKRTEGERDRGVGVLDRGRLLGKGIERAPWEQYLNTIVKCHAKTSTGLKRCSIKV